MKKVIILFIVLLLLLSVLGPAGNIGTGPYLALAQAEPNQLLIQNNPTEKITPAVQEKLAALAPGEMLTV